MKADTDKDRCICKCRYAYVDVYKLKARNCRKIIVKQTHSTTVEGIRKKQG